VGGDGLEHRIFLGRITAKTFVMPMSSDMFFPPSDCQAEWRLIPNAEFRPIQTVDGHLNKGVNPFPFDSALQMEADGRAGALNLGHDARWLRPGRFRPDVERTGKNASPLRRRLETKTVDDRALIADSICNFDVL
jgi:hypothetical protein